MMSQDKLVEAIEHYQRNLNRGLKEENTAKLLHCIFKLSNMPITVAHLEHTGVGRTVNAMRKIDGEVGDAARELVNKWKLMVSQNQDCDETNASESNSKSDSSQRSSDKAKSKERYKQEPRQRSEDREERSEKSGSESENSSSDEDNSESSDNTEDEEEEEEKRRRSESPPRKYEKTTTHKEKQYESDARKEYNDKHKGSNYKEKVSDERRKEYKDKHKESNEKSKDHRERNEGQKEKYNRSPEKERYKSGSEREKHRSGSPEKDKNRERHGDGKHRESGKRKRENDVEENQAKKPKTHHKDETRHKKEKDKYPESGHREKDAKKESRRDDVKSQSREKSKGLPEEKPKVHRNENGICSESGTSFAEALGMLEPSTSKGGKKVKPEKAREKEKSPEKQKEPSSKSESKEKPKKDRSSKTGKQESSKEHEKKVTKMDIVIPPPPPKNDLDINISSLLPTITPNYRPLANPLYDSPQNCKGKMLNDDEALSLVMSQKNQRTKVYSGIKMLWGSVPTLFELCIRVLQDNIDALEYTGGVPFAILKPVLDKATPQQLYMMEHYNPYLIEDTDDIWKFHCSKQFKNKKREELESWRDMYMRCLDEREAKLKALTENIKVAQEKSTPVRQTKLAYIDSVVKPPRDVIRKQAKNGIDKKPLITPQSRLNAIASGSSTAQVSVPNPVRASSSNSSAAVKPKKAPLMQKTLAFLKGGRFRR